MLKIEYRDALIAMKDQAAAANAMLYQAETADQRRINRKSLRDAKHRMALHSKECTEIARLLSRSEDPEQTIETLTAEALEVAMDRASSQVFRVFHHYDIGNQAVFVRRSIGDADVRRAAAYIQTMANAWFGESTELGNLAIASALVAFYGCQHWSETALCQQVDMYSVRAGFNDEQLKCETDLYREGLREYLERHAGLGRFMVSDLQGRGVIYANLKG